MAFVATISPCTVNALSAITSCTESDWKMCLANYGVKYAASCSNTAERPHVNASNAAFPINAAAVITVRPHHHRPVAPNAPTTPRTPAETGPHFRAPSDITKTVHNAPSAPMAAPHRLRVRHQFHPVISRWGHRLQKSPAMVYISIIVRIKKSPIRGIFY